MMEDRNVPEIGPVLQRERKQRGLTLEQLASLSGVSKSMLSQIERGEANPTFAVLWSLTRALKVEFGQLFNARKGAADESAIELVTAAHTPEIRNADETCRLRILSPPRLAGRIEWYELEVSPGGALDSAGHAPGTFEHFTALTQGFEIRSGESTRRLRAGETARYPADVPHRIANIASKRAKGLMVVLYR